MDAPLHALNWHAGWLMLLASFISGAIVGLGFHRQDFLGGYGSFRRRLLRLGHVAFAALGTINVLFALSPWPPQSHWTAPVASLSFVVGGAAMPLVCLLAAWRPGFRHLFAVPVAALVVAVVCTWLGGVS